VQKHYTNFDKEYLFNFYVLLTVHLNIIFVNKTNWRTIF